MDIDEFQKKELNRLRSMIEEREETISKLRVEIKKLEDEKDEIRMLGEKLISITRRN